MIWLDLCFVLKHLCNHYVFKPIVSELLTGHQGEGTYAGKGGDVHVHLLQFGGKFNNAVNPLPEASCALESVPHRAITED